MIYIINILIYILTHHMQVKLLGVEAGGVSGISGVHAAPISASNFKTLCILLNLYKPGVISTYISIYVSIYVIECNKGVFHGQMCNLIQDAGGQILETHSISAGLDYPGLLPYIYSYI